MITSYQCPGCSFQTKFNKLYVKHLRVHANVPNFSFMCAVEYCHLRFKKYKSLCVHTERLHSHKFKVPITGNVNRCSKFMCSYAACQRLECDRGTVIAHLRKHLKNCESVICPFKSCQSKFHVLSTFTSHISRIHSNESSSNLNSTPLVASLSNAVVDFDIDAGPSNVNSAGSRLCSEAEDADETVLLEYVALLYLKLQAQLHVPSSTIQAIVEGVTSMSELSKDHVKKKIKSVLSNCNVSDDIITRVAKEINDTDMLIQIHKGPMKSQFKRKQYYKKHFNYVEPVTIDLGLNDCNQKRVCHYIPVLETVRHVFSNVSVQEQRRSQRLHEDDVYTDITDGSVYRGNKFFKDHPNAAKLILYQDAFEVCNPLGSSRKKHKILAFYVLFADILPHHRSAVNTAQCVLLCRENDMKYFGSKAVLTPLLLDLKSLEDSGVVVSGQEIIHGSLLVVCGDNLGSHFIGGFQEHFCKNQYYCRYCTTSRADIDSGNQTISTFEPRTPKNYDADVEKIKNDTTGLTSVRGITKASVFNVLTHFHVCNAGLPPCIAHDLFEGVVQYDLAIFIRYFVQKKWFTYKQLNHKLAWLKFPASDSANKPAPFKEYTKKGKPRLIGHAVQNWCCLRVITLLVGGYVRDSQDPVWQILLKLKILVSIVCLSKITTSQIAVLQTLIEEYLSGRTMLFPNIKLRCKHHYMAHYPSLIMKLGPLIHLWTMRFESKHRFFKNAISSSKNFKNVTKSMSETHELLQAYLRQGTLFCSDVSDDGFKRSPLEIYSALVIAAYRGCHCYVSDNLMVGQCSSVKGTIYKVGQYLIVSRNEDDYTITIGKVVVFFRSLNVTHIIVQIVNASLDCSNDLYIVEGTTNKFVCVHQEGLVDYYPLSAYIVQKKVLLTLKHYVYP